MTETGGASGSGPEADAWPVKCPVDGRWVSDGDACPDCGLSVAPLRAINDLAAVLLLEASQSSDSSTAAALVSNAASLVVPTERFHEAAADSLEAAGRPDLALQQVRAALAIAPRRKDLLTRATELEARPVAGNSRSDRLARWSLLAGAAVVLLMVGAIGALGFDRAFAQPRTMGSSGAPISIAMASPSARPAEPSASSTPTPAASPAPSGSTPPAGTPDPVQLVRAVLAATSVPGSGRLAVESIDGEVRISGPVKDAEAYSLLRAAVDGVAPGLKVDLDGVTFPRPRYAYVQSGDTLWSIAAHMYGDPTRWRRIAAANARIDPSKIHAGQRLAIP